MLMDGQADIKKVKVSFVISQKKRKNLFSPTHCTGVPYDYHNSCRLLLCTALNDLLSYEVCTEIIHGK